MIAGCGADDDPAPAACRHRAALLSKQELETFKPPACAANRASVNTLLGKVQDAARASAPTSAGAFRTVITPYHTPRFLYGKGFRLEPTKPHNDPQSAAVDIALAYQGLFGLGPDDSLAPDKPVSAGGRHRVYLRQLHKGLPVTGAGLYLVLDSSYAAIAVGNSTVPDITRSPVPAVSQAAAESALSALHLGYKSTSADLGYRPRRAYCDTARLAWHIRYSASSGPREAWVDAHDGQVIKDSSAVPQVSGVVGVYEQTTGCDQQQLGNPLKPCSQLPCSSLSGTALEICSGLSDLWDFWYDESLHSELRSKSYDDSDSCLAGNLACSDGATDASSDWSSAIPGSGYYAWAETTHQTKGVMAHEYGHVLIDHNVGEAPEQQDHPVYEHLADMQALAIDCQWKITRANGCPIRDWENPASFTTTCSGQTVYFPVTFDDYNEHSWLYDGAAQRPNHYIKWHVPSTLWSHMIYNLAHKPGLDRQKAASVAFRTLRAHLQTHEDIAFTPYQFYLQLEADSMGSPYDWAMAEVQDEARLWRFSERILEDCYSRPGMAFVWNSYHHELQVYFNEYRPRQSNKLLMASKDLDSGTWSTQDTGLSPGTVGSGLTAAYEYGFYTGKVHLAWTGPDQKIYHTWRELGGAWAPLQQVAGVSSRHAPVLVAGSDVRLFYQDAATGGLRYVEWSGSAWGSPQSLPTAALAREPAVTWDASRSRYVVLYIEGAEGADGEVKYLEILPGQPYDVVVWGTTFDKCAYTTGPHPWTGQITAAVQDGKLYLLGTRHGEPNCHQAAMSLESGQWKFWHHGAMERATDAIVVKSGPPGLYAATWRWDPYGSTASIFSK